MLENASELLWMQGLLCPAVLFRLMSPGFPVFSLWYPILSDFICPHYRKLLLTNTDKLRFPAAIIIILQSINVCSYSVPKVLIWISFSISFLPIYSMLLIPSLSFLLLPPASVNSEVFPFFFFLFFLQLDVITKLIIDDNNLYFVQNHLLKLVKLRHLCPAMLQNEAGMWHILTSCTTLQGDV